MWRTVLALFDPISDHKGNWAMEMCVSLMQFLIRIFISTGGVLPEN